MDKLWRCYVVTRHYTVDNIFIAPEEAITPYCGHFFVVSDFNNKYLEIVFDPLEMNDFKMLSDDNVLIAKLKEIFPSGIVTGIDLLSYFAERLNEQEED